MNLIHQNGERLFVTSLDISNRFGRQHIHLARMAGRLPKVGEGQGHLDLEGQHHD
ncbi:MAG: hypothetical protein LBE24_10555 [Methylobacillus sp.]|nr:hypothetical protein [Methylobacillus sp.]